MFHITPLYYTKTSNVDSDFLLGQLFKLPPLKLLLLMVILVCDNCYLNTLMLSFFHINYGPIICYILLQFIVILQFLM